MINFRKRIFHYPPLFLSLCAAAPIYAQSVDLATSGAIVRSAQIETASAEIETLRQQLKQDRVAVAAQGRESTDTEIASGALKIERLRTAQRNLIQARRESEASTKRAERWALQERLASASTTKERRAILNQHIALTLAIRAEPKAEKVGDGRK